MQLIAKGGVMTIVVPVWLLWLMGGVLGLVVLALAALGVMFVLMFKDFRLR